MFSSVAASTGKRFNLNGGDPSSISSSSIRMTAYRIGLMPADAAMGSRNGKTTKRMGIVSMNMPGKRNIRTIDNRNANLLRSVR